MEVSREKAVRSAVTAPHACSLQSVLRSPQLTLPEKREYFSAELSMGAVQMLIPCQWCPPCVPSFYLYQSTLPFREDGPLPLAEVCRDGAQVVSKVGEHARRWRAVLEAACARWRVSS